MKKNPYVVVHSNNWAVRGKGNSKVIRITCYQPINIAYLWLNIIWVSLNKVIPLSLLSKF